MKLTIFLVLFINVGMTKSADILVFMPLPTFSHFGSIEPLCSELFNRGHNVTVLSGVPPQQNTPYRHIHLLSLKNELKISFAEMRKQTRFSNAIYAFQKIHSFMNIVVKDQIVRNTLNPELNRYDVIITELFYMDSVVTLGRLLNAPVVGVSTINILPYYSWFIGNPTTFSYIPHTYLPLTDEMSFLERTVNSVFTTLNVLYFRVFCMPKVQSQVEEMYKLYNRTDVPNVEQAFKNISLVLVNSHFTAGYVRPLPPNVIDVAGMHIPPLEPLPKDLQTFMDKSGDAGVIYISLGSLIEPELVKNLGQMLVHILRDLPHRVVWKWNVQLLPTVPKNFFVKQWLPQMSILSHTKCRLFITHGGYHSIVEAIATHVPVVVIPFFTDQQHNLELAKKLGIGSGVYEIQEAGIRDAVHEVLRNPKYLENSIKRSKLFKDRPKSPLERAIYWTEYVINHGGAKHLKTAATELSWCQYLLFDILVLFVTSVAIVTLLSYKLIEIMWTCLRNR